MLASVFPSQGIELTPGDTSTVRESKVTGQLTKSNGHYYIKDRTTNVTFELAHAKLDAPVGSDINVTGTVDTRNVALGAGGVFDVTSYVPSVSSAQTGAAKGRASGISKTAIIAGAAGSVFILTVTPLAMAGVFSGGSSNPVSPH